MYCDGYTQVGCEASSEHSSIIQCSAILSQLGCRNTYVLCADRCPSSSSLLVRRHTHSPPAIPLRIRPYPPPTPRLRCPLFFCTFTPRLSDPNFSFVASRLSLLALFLPASPLAAPLLLVRSGVSPLLFSPPPPSAARRLPAPSSGAFASAGLSPSPRPARRTPCYALPPSRPRAVLREMRTGPSPSSSPLNLPSLLLTLLFLIENRYRRVSSLSWPGV